MIEFNCHNSAVCTSPTSSSAKMCSIHFSYITANYGENSVSQMLKCFSFWEAKSARLPIGVFPWTPLGDFHPVPLFLTPSKNL